MSTALTDEQLLAWWDDSKRAWLAEDCEALGKAHAWFRLRGIFFGYDDKLHAALGCGCKEKDHAAVGCRNCGKTVDLVLEPDPQAAERAGQRHQDRVTRLRQEYDALVSTRARVQERLEDIREALEQEGEAP